MTRWNKHNAQLEALAALALRAVAGAHPAARKRGSGPARKFTRELLGTALIMSFEVIASSTATGHFLR